ncbi:MAG: DNA gyrase inhibitor YacG [Terriglobia bacterium]
MPGIAPLFRVARPKFRTPAQAGPASPARVAPMAAHCPRCGREVNLKGNAFRPFCGERCKLIDLDNWLSARYRISSAAPETPDGAEESSSRSGDEAHFESERVTK